MKLVGLTLALFAAYVLPARAQVLKDTTTYLCRFRGKLFPLELDSARRAFLWRGKTYTTTELEAGADTNPCPRFGWHVEGNGEAFNFCTATHGYGDFKDVECRQQYR